MSQTKIAKTVKFSFNARFEVKCPHCNKLNIVIFNVDPYRIPAEDLPEHHQCTRCYEHFNITAYETNHAINEIDEDELIRDIASVDIDSEEPAPTAINPEDKLPEGAAPLPYFKNLSDNPLINLINQIKERAKRGSY